jgi:hypothetical protein
MPKIKTKITIAAPPSTVRNIILTFPSYPAWNPFITSATPASPSAAPGTPIKVTISKFIHQNATIDKNDPGEFSWLSIIVGKWFFNAYHEVKFEQIAEGGCEVVQSEKLGGLLSGLSFIYGGWMKKGFKKMNKALKFRAEAQAAVGEGLGGS